MRTLLLSEPVRMRLCAVITLLVVARSLWKIARMLFWLQICKVWTLAPPSNLLTIIRRSCLWYHLARRLRVMQRLVS